MEPARMDLGTPPYRTVMAAAWPSFIVALVAEFVFFALVDPAELPVLGLHLPLSRPTVYSFGFFAFWALGALSSSLTLFFVRERRA
jgi:hypothetical protein